METPQPQESKLKQKIFAFREYLYLLKDCFSIYNLHRKESHLESIYDNFSENYAVWCARAGPNDADERIMHNLLEKLTTFQGESLILEAKRGVRSAKPRAEFIRWYGALDRYLEFRKKK